MIDDLRLLQLYGSMANHAALKMAVASGNIANADTPGYKSKEVESFDAYLQRLSHATEVTQNKTDISIFESNAFASPNGNSVSLEQELFAMAQASGQHERAMTVYGKTLDLLRMALGKGR